MQDGRSDFGQPANQARSPKQWHEPQPQSQYTTEVERDLKPILACGQNALDHGTENITARQHDFQEAESQSRKRATKM